MCKILKKLLSTINLLCLRTRIVATHSASCEGYTGQTSTWSKHNQERNRQQNSPMALAQWVEAKLVSNVCCIHRIGQILFVGKHKQNCITQLILQGPTNSKCHVWDTEPIGITKQTSKEVQGQNIQGSCDLPNFQCLEYTQSLGL